MELALYCPDFGYYERPDRTPGRAGDFFTNVSVGPVFGGLLAAGFSRWLAQFAGQTVQIVEAGAHDGQLALDILSWFERHQSASWPHLQYWLIEPSVRRRQWQAARLARFADRIRWFDSPDLLGTETVRGVFFSNELLDAFPVVRLRWSVETQSWMEMGVRAGPEGYEWNPLPVTPDRLKAMLDEAALTMPSELEQVLPNGFTLDLAEDAGRWWHSAARALSQGVLMTIDYGLTAEGLLNPARAAGTLRAYHRHHLGTDLLSNPGEQDLTSHVNFSQLIRAGTSAGLISEPIQTQTQFLLGILRELQASGEMGSLDSAQARRLQTLVHPEHLGSRFQVFVQRAK